MWFKRLRYSVEWQGPAAIIAFGSLSVAFYKAEVLWLIILFGVAGLLLVWLAAHNTYHKQSMALIDKYDEKFDKMRNERRGAACYLLKKPPANPQEPTGEEDLEDVLDFFEAPIAAKMDLKLKDVKLVEYLEQEARLRDD